ncbi:hypothetical protein MTP09_14005 [Chryseobacterium suipulveris]|uniref:Phosphoribosylpyrophosphate synthetase n=1 Tax=Chryseobacterium suipulveris TaxID=2929800 RepID=A0ABY4BP81_9FLAO|nr:hypothetical protein [Chryseobacterium suipulveris]UOE40998.1 hypothetical protein MTP09_14005 [Chryseobacterium suipulveris]
MAHHNLKTLSEVLETLRRRGITKEIRMNKENVMVLGDNEKTYKPSDLSIVKSYRFEGNSSADDNAVLYLIEDREGEKATILDSYGSDSNYSGPEFDNFLRQIPFDEKSEYDSY